MARRAIARPGEALELFVEQSLQQMLAKGLLGIAPACGSVHRHRSYHSRDRDDVITFDVCLEVRRLGATEPFLLWIWECKDLTHAVAVDEVEEFHAKLEEIGVHRAKGTMVSTSGFQKGAFSVAKAKGIGLVQITSRGVLRHLLEVVDTRGRENAGPRIGEVGDWTGNPVRALSSYGDMVHSIDGYILSEMAQFRNQGLV